MTFLLLTTSKSASKVSVIAQKKQKKRTILGRLNKKSRDFDLGFLDANLAYL
jgi:hypothetical protein